MRDCELRNHQYRINNSSQLKCAVNEEKRALYIFNKIDLNYATEWNRMQRVPVSYN